MKRDSALGTPQAYIHIMGVSKGEERENEAERILQIPGNSSNLMKSL